MTDRLREAAVALEDGTTSPRTETRMTDRCPQEYAGYQCRKEAGHRGVHYADTNNECGVGWGSLDMDGYPND